MKFAHKYEIMPTDAQKIIINKSFAATRHVYNWALALKLENKKLTSSVISKKLTDYKKTILWLNEVNAQALIAELRTLDNAFKKFYDLIKKNKGKNKLKNKFKKSNSVEEFKKRNKLDNEWGILPFLKGFPNFKGKFDKQSFSNQQDNQTGSSKRQNKIEDTFLSIRKIFKIPVILHRPITGEIGTIVISKTVTGRYYASITLDDSIDLPKPKEIKKENQILGLDLGCRDLVTCSDGEIYDRENFTKKHQNRLSVLQQRLCKKRIKNKNWKESKKYNELRIQVAKVHEKTSFSRSDKIHKTTHAIVNKDQIAFGMEDLNVQGMVKNHKLASSISDASFYEIKRQLKYKSEKSGKSVIEVDRFFASSKICHRCGHKNSDLKMEKEWKCPQCNFKHDRDINASINIRKEAAKQVGL